MGIQQQLLASYGTTVAARTYATWNPSDKDASFTLSGDNLIATKGTASTWRSLRANQGKSSGKWYWEITTSSTVGYCLPGVANSTMSLASYTGVDANGWGYFGNSGNKFNNGGTAYGATWNNTHTIGIALDMDAGTLTFYKNNVSQGQAFTGITGTVYPCSSLYDNASTCTANFGATMLTYTPPSGYNTGVYV